MTAREHGPLAGVPAERAAETHPVWDVIAPRDGVGGFLPAEFRYPYQMDARFLVLLHQVRLAAGVPMRITSDHRPPARNAAAGGASNSAHLEAPCAAVDLSVRGNAERYHILRAAIMHGIHRIGVARYAADSGTGAGIMHLDASRTLPPDVCW